MHLFHLNDEQLRVSRLGGRVGRDDNRTVRQRQRLEAARAQPMFAQGLRQHRCVYNCKQNNYGCRRRRREHYPSCRARVVNSILDIVDDPKSFACGCLAFLTSLFLLLLSVTALGCVLAGSSFTDTLMSRVMLRHVGFLEFIVRFPVDMVITLIRLPFLILYVSYNFINDYMLGGISIIITLLSSCVSIIHNIITSKQLRAELAWMVFRGILWTISIDLVVYLIYKQLYKLYTMIKSCTFNVYYGDTYITGETRCIPESLFRLHPTMSLFYFSHDGTYSKAFIGETAEEQFDVFHRTRFPEGNSGNLYNDDPTYTNTEYEDTAYNADEELIPRNFFKTESEADDDDEYMNDSEIDDDSDLYSDTDCSSNYDEDDEVQANFVNEGLELQDANNWPNRRLYAEALAACAAASVPPVPAAVGTFAPAAQARTRGEQLLNASEISESATERSIYGLQGLPTTLSGNIQPEGVEGEDREGGEEEYEEDGEEDEEEYEEDYEEEEGEEYGEQEQEEYEEEDEEEDSGDECEGDAAEHEKNEVEAEVDWYLVSEDTAANNNVAAATEC